MDPTPLIPVMKEDPGPEPVSLTDRLLAMSAATSRALDILGRPMAGPAAAWKREADRRKASRTEDALNLIRKANKDHRDAMRDVRRDRKAFETARGEVSWWNVVNGERRAARLVVQDSQAIARELNQKRREARRAYLLPLSTLVARCHAAHFVPAFLWNAVADGAASTLALCGSVAVIACNVGVVKLGSRATVADATPSEETLVADDEVTKLIPTPDEDDLLHCLDPGTWPDVAAPRGLEDVVSNGATLTLAGIQAKLTLNGTMDVPTLQKREDQVRAALRLDESTRLEIRPGKTGGTARLTIRTRSMADDMDMEGWWPGAPWAVDTVTGELIDTTLGKRLLVAGTSGAGKSWSARPLMAEASEYEDHRLVIFDRKYVEARTWEHRARTVSELDEMEALCNELSEEGEDRLRTLPRGRDVIDISPSRPRITVVVDEGGELITDCVKPYDVIIDRLRTIARKYRAAEIILVWMTQKPSMSGKGHGIDSQVAGNLPNRLSLAVTTSTEARVVFGDDATEKGWKSHDLPMPGYALLRRQDLGGKSVPHMLKMRAMSPEQVIELPSRPIWSRTVSSTGATAQDIEARKKLEAPAKAPRMSSEDRDTQLIDILTDDPGRTLSDLSREAGASKSVVKRRLDRMAAEGVICQDEDGLWHPVPWQS